MQYQKALESHCRATMIEYCEKAGDGAKGCEIPRHESYTSVTSLRVSRRSLRSGRRVHIKIQDDITSRKHRIREMVPIHGVSLMVVFSEPHCKLTTDVTDETECITWWYRAPNYWQGMDYHRSIPGMGGKHFHYDWLLRHTFQFHDIYEGSLSASTPVTPQSHTCHPT